MAVHLNFPIKSPNKDTVEIVGSFAPDTANPPTTLYGKGFTVARSSQGVYTLTFDRVYPKLISAIATIQLASATARFAQIGTYTAAAGTLVISNLDATGTAQDIAANANNRVNFRAVFSLSSI